MKAVKSVHDTVTFTLNEADLTGKKVGEVLEVPKRYISCSDGLEWWISYYPAGQNNKNANDVSVFLYVNKAVLVKDSYAVNGTPFHGEYIHHHTALKGIGLSKFASHDTLRQHFTNGQLSITCNVEFSIPVPFSFLTTRMVRFSDHVPTDFEIVVGLDRLKVHKGYISMISPVFHAMLSHKTAEVRSGKVNITDFDVETVKAAIDFCYGREPENLCINTIVGILRFADKYDIRPITEDLAMIPLANLSPETFATIAHYAYDCSKDALFQTCCKYFKEHQSEIVTTVKFTTLAPSFVTRLLEKAFDLKSQYEILRHAHANGIGFILDPLEQPIIEAMSLETFCNTVKYAWECSRDTVQNACGKFFNDNQAEIRKMKEFYDLPPNVVYEVLKKGYDVL